jgi:DNA uptake protein ComE-like DNA-binding protein
MDSRTFRLVATVVAILIGVVFTARVATMRMAEARKEAAAYPLACEGKPLRSVEQRSKAMEDGYVINRIHDCIDKASFAAVAEERARWEAANTPEAKARDAAIRAAHQAENAALQSLATQIQPPPPAEPEEGLPEIPYRAQDVNTAPESDLATAFGLSPDMAREVVEERATRPFRDWPDLIDRVAGLHSARNTMFATIGGLNDKGKPMPGAPPDASMVMFARESLRKGNRTSRKVMYN